MIGHGSSGGDGVLWLLSGKKEEERKRRAPKDPLYSRILGQLVSEWRWGCGHRVVEDRVRGFGVVRPIVLKKKADNPKFVP